MADLPRTELRAILMDSSDIANLIADIRSYGKAYYKVGKPRDDEQRKNLEWLKNEIIDQLKGKKTLDFAEFQNIVDGTDIYRAVAKQADKVLAGRLDPYQKPAIGETQEEFQAYLVKERAIQLLRHSDKTLDAVDDYNEIKRHVNNITGWFSISHEVMKDATQLKLQSKEP